MKLHEQSSTKACQFNPQTVSTEVSGTNLCSSGYNVPSFIFLPCPLIYQLYSQTGEHRDNRSTKWLKVQALKYVCLTYMIQPIWNMLSIWKLSSCIGNTKDIIWKGKIN